MAQRLVEWKIMRRIWRSWEYGSIWAKCTFNTAKCKDIHLEAKSAVHSYRLGTVPCNAVMIGIILDNQLNMSITNCYAVTKNVNAILGCLHMGVVSNRDIILLLYEALVRTILEYCIQYWYLHYRKDVEKLERVQKRALQLVWGWRKCLRDWKSLTCQLIKKGSKRWLGWCPNMFLGRQYLVPIGSLIAWRKVCNKNQ